MEDAKNIDCLSCVFLNRTYNCCVWRGMKNLPPHCKVVDKRKNFVYSKI